MWYAHVIGGVAVLLLGIATIVAAWTTVPYGGEFGPGPGFLPLWLGVVLSLSAIPVIVASWRSREHAGRLFRPETVQSVKVLGMIVAVFLVLPISGFSVGLALITGGGMRILGRHRWRSCAATVMGTAIAIHYVFGQWLAIPLPKGLLGW
ncbi:MAG: tripartite tricarboxylate transporter TctB family protein [Candidatus Methylomirabilales bacterium]